MNDLQEPAAEDAPEESPEAELTVSEWLVQTREAKGLTQKDVADQLYLTVSFISYLDSAEFDKIPKPAFVKGYLRSYARVLGLSGDDAVALYERSLESGKDGAGVGLRGVTEERVGSSNFTGPVAQTGIFGLVGIVIVSLLVWRFAPDEEAGAPEDALVVEAGQDADLMGAAADRPGDAAALPVDVPVPGADSDLYDDRVLFSPLVGGDDDDPQGVVADELIEPDEGGEMVADSGTGDVSLTPEREYTVERDEDDTRIITVRTNGSDHLQFVFEGECWLEIDDATGLSIYNDLNRAGDTLNIFGMAPFDILIGRVQAVVVSFNDRAVAIRPNALNDTAKVTVGR